MSVPAEGFYCRPVVALSIMFSPAWLAFYLSQSHDIDLISQGRISFLSVMLVISTFLGILVVRYGPAGEGPMSLGAAVSSLKFLLLIITYDNFNISLKSYRGLLLCGDS